MTADADSPSELIQQRRDHLEALRERGNDPYQERFKRTHRLIDLVEGHSELEAGEHGEGPVSTAGRIKAIRRHGKASFIVIDDGTASFQLYLAVNNLEDDYEEFLSFDIGDIVGVGGPVFRTRRGELSVEVKEFKLLTKSLLPLPEKWHGLKDVEIRYRQRYLDLIVNPDVRKVFDSRIAVISGIREFLNERMFQEVETPMLQSIRGGAPPWPFTTQHHPFFIVFFLRVAPYFYLTRLVVGGYDRIYEINRNFRNEGMSIMHNPEFTMLEVYQAYADYGDMMELTEGLIKAVAKRIGLGDKVSYQGEELDFGAPFIKMTFLESLKTVGGFDLSFDMSIDELRGIAEEAEVPVNKADGKGKIMTEIFEKYVEGKLIQPTFILDYPVEVTPLAKGHPDHPELAERFELMMCGREIANAFSELTDPLEQRRRFEKQVELRTAGDDEAQFLDEDFLRALEIGLPPTGGLGIGIDRLVMILTDSASIRDVILFPQMRPEAR